MKLFRVILPVCDIEVATTFYTHVFQVQGVRVSPGRHYYHLGPTILACYDAIADGDEIGTLPLFNENQYLYFSTNDLNSIHSRVLASSAMRCDRQIQTMPWGEKLFYAHDPFNNPICFVDADTVFTGK